MGTRNIALMISVLPFTGSGGIKPGSPLSGSELEASAGYDTDGYKYLGGNPKFDIDEDIFERTAFNLDSTSTDDSATDDSATDDSATDGCVTDGNTADDIGTDGSATTDGRTTDHSATDGSVTDTVGAKGTVWLPWTSSELGPSYEHGEIDRCSCVSITDAEYVCDTWACSRSAINIAIPCCNSDDYWCVHEKGLESARSVCWTTYDPSGTICASFTCVQRDPDGGQEFEQYRCVRASSSGEYWGAWTEVSESSEEVEVSICVCLGQRNGIGLCSYWKCKERGLTQWSNADSTWRNTALVRWAEWWLIWAFSLLITLCSPLMKCIQLVWFHRALS